MNNIKHGLEFLLTKDEAENFLKSISLKIAPPSLCFLKNIISMILRSIPFHNLFMLTRPRLAPTFDEIKNDMLMKRGGLCTTMNPFLCGLLYQLGFEVNLISSGIYFKNKVKFDCHMGLLITINNNYFWCDIGNGFPYTEPLALNENSLGVHPFLTWRLQKKEGNCWCVKHKTCYSKNWTSNQLFCTKPRHYSFFEKMRKHHYTELNYGPFLTGIRVNSWTKKGGMLMRDKLAWTIPISKEQVDLEGAITWLNENFSDILQDDINLFEDLLIKSWTLLKWGKNERNSK